MNATADALTALLTEACFGPPDPKFTWFAENAPDSGLCGTLDQLDAATASKEPAPGRRTIAGHARHATVHLEATLAYLRGDKSAVDWDASFGPPSATPAEWDAIRSRVRKAAEAMRDAVPTFDLSDADTVKGLIGAVAHVAYHLGAINQIAKAVRP